MNRGYTLNSRHSYPPIKMLSKHTIYVYGGVGGGGSYSTLNALTEHEYWLR